MFRGKELIVKKIEKFHFWKEITYKSKDCIYIYIEIFAIKKKTHTHISLWGGLPPGQTIENGLQIEICSENLLKGSNK